MLSKLHIFLMCFFICFLFLFLYPETVYSEAVAPDAPIGDEQPNQSEEVEIPEGLLTTIKDFLIGIVVPSDDFFSRNYDALDAKLKSKLPYQIYIDTIGRLKDISATGEGNFALPSFEFRIIGGSFGLPLSDYISPHIPFIRSILRGFFAVLMAYYNYRQILFIIRGNTLLNNRDH